MPGVGPLMDARAVGGAALSHENSGSLATSHMKDGALGDEFRETWQLVILRWWILQLQMNANSECFFYGTFL